MKKIILILGVILLAQFNLTSADNNYSCSEKEVTQDEAQNLISNTDVEMQIFTGESVKKKIDNFIEKNNLGGDYSNDYNGNNSVISNNSAIICKSDKSDFTNQICSVFVKNSKVKTFNYSADFTYITGMPEIFETTDGKHYAYSYMNNEKEVCLNQDGVDKCFGKNYLDGGTNGVYYTFPTNLIFSTDGSTFAYSITKGTKGTDQKCGIDKNCKEVTAVKYNNYIIINGKEYNTYDNYEIYDKDTIIGLENNSDVYGFFPQIMRQLGLSPNGKDYAYRKLTFSNNISKVLFYKNGELLNNNLKNDENFGFTFSNAGDLYYVGNDVTQNKTLLYKNKELITSDYFYDTIYKIDGDNLNFVGMKSNQKIYDVSCSMTSNTIKEEVKTTTTYTLTTKEIQAIKIIADKINNMSSTKRSSYIKQLNMYATKFKEGSRNYQIVKELLDDISAYYKY